MQIWLCVRFWLFIDIHPLTLTAVIYVDHPLLIAGDNMVQPIETSVLGEEEGADLRTLVELLSRECMRYPTSQLDHLSQSLKLVNHSRVRDAECSGNAAAGLPGVRLYQLS